MKLRDIVPDELKARIRAEVSDICFGPGYQVVEAQHFPALFDEVYRKDANPESPHRP